MRTLLLAFIALGFTTHSRAATDDQPRSAAAFEEALKVFKHPRCQNCHPAADHPTQGADKHAHTMNVQRGPADHGMPGMNCVGCHTEANYEPAGVPGAPKWGLAPREMAWQGLSDHQLCEQLKDPKRNGGKTLAQLVEHNANDPLVGWAWHPGAGREPAPGTQAEFGRQVSLWVETGAACP